jgi:hypothetical protein
LFREIRYLFLADIFGCTVGTFPIKYLGITLHFDKLRRVDIQPFIDKILKRISVWRGELPLMQPGSFLSKLV